MNIEYKSGRFILARTPLLKFADYPSGSEAETRRKIFEVLQLEYFREAILISSSKLYESLYLWENAYRSYIESGTFPNDKVIRNIELSILKYIIRASTRPTPYGTLCGISSMSTSQDIKVSVDSPLKNTTRTQIDFSHVWDLVKTCEGNLEFSDRIKIYTHPGVIRKGKRYLLEGVPVKGEGEMRSASILVTSVTTAIFDTCRYGSTVNSVIDGLTLMYPHKTRVFLMGVLKSIINSGFIFSDIRPSPICDDPVRHVLSSIQDDQEWQREIDYLNKVGDIMAAADKEYLGQGIEHYKNLTAICGTDLDGNERESIYKVDMTTALSEGNMSQDVLDEAALAFKAATLLTSSNSHYAHIQDYLQKFKERYGQRMVPINEILNENIGLGPLDGYINPSARRIKEERTKISNSRDQKLLRLAYLNASREEIILSDQMVNEISEVYDFNPRFPESGEIYFRILAKSQDEINQGNYRLEISPMGYTAQAGKTFGRFHGSLPSEVFDQFVKPDSDEIAFAQANFLVTKSRFMNVSSKFKSAAYEIYFGTPPNSSGKFAINAHDILVGVSGDEFYFYSTIIEKEIRISSSHMLTLLLAPNMVRFMEEAERLRCRTPVPFTWGKMASYLPYLPRLVYRKTILSPRMWQLDQEELQKLFKLPSSELIAAFRALCSQKHIPQYIEYGSDDNLLTLDLQSDVHIKLLLKEMAKGDGQRIIRESFKQIENLWANSENGSYVQEFVAPVFLEAPPKRQTRTAKAALQDSSHRIEPIGGNWIYLKIYIGFNNQKEIIANNISKFIDQHKHMIDTWFYVIYQDPNDHVRLRIKAHNDHLELLLPHVFNWIRLLKDDATISDVQFADYERELERYGGVALMNESERAFGRSSDWCVRNIASLVKTNGTDENRILKAGLSTIIIALSYRGDLDILRVLRNIAASYKNHYQEKEYKSKKYDMVKKLKPLIIEDLQSDQIADLLKTAESRALVLVYSDLFQKAEALLKTDDFVQFISSHLHMNANRIGVDRFEEYITYTAAADALFEMRQKNTLQRIEKSFVDLLCRKQQLLEA